jgi:hypothetical protein
MGTDDIREDVDRMARETVERGRDLAEDNAQALDPRVRESDEHDAARVSEGEAPAEARDEPRTEEEQIPQTGSTPLN